MYGLHNTIKGLATDKAGVTWTAKDRLEPVFRIVRHRLVTERAPPIALPVPCWHVLSQF